MVRSLVLIQESPQRCGNMMLSFTITIFANSLSHWHWNYACSTSEDCGLVYIIDSMWLLRPPIQCCSCVSIQLIALHCNLQLQIQAICTFFFYLYILLLALSPQILVCSFWALFGKCYIFHLIDFLWATALFICQNWMPSASHPGTPRSPDFQRRSIQCLLTWTCLS